VQVYSDRFSKFINGVKELLRSYHYDLDIKEHQENGDTTETTVTITLRK
jgi:hypothetical protein